MRRFAKRTLVNLGLKIGLSPQLLIPKNEYQKVLEFLRPYSNGHSLIRVGGQNDGGYLIPNDLENIEVCISLGVGKMIDFELDLWNKFGIKSYLYDGSVDAPKNLIPELIFSKKFISSFQSTSHISLQDVLHKDLAFVKGDLLAQIDIESNEYALLASLSSEDLNRFRIITIEFHNLYKWLNKDFYAIMLESIFPKFLDLFDLVHAHPNNYGREFQYKKITIPNIISAYLLL